MDVFCVKVVVTLVESDYPVGFSQTPPDLCHFEGRGSQNQVEICVRMRIPQWDLQALWNWEAEIEEETGRRK